MRRRISSACTTVARRASYLGEGTVRVEESDVEKGWRRAWAGRRMEDRRRGDSVDLEARDRVARESVWTVTG